MIVFTVAVPFIVNGAIILQTVVRQLGNAREMLREARRQGIMPLQFRRRDFRHFLINRLPGLYVLYYKLHKRQK